MISDIEIQKAMIEKARPRTKVLLICAGILYPLWAVNDYLFAPEQFTEFLAIRLIEVLPIVLIYWLFAKKKILPSTSVHLLFFPICTEIAYMCNVVNEDALIPFFLGYATVFSVIYIVSLMSFVTALLYYIYGIVVLIGINYFVGNFSLEIMFKHGGLMYSSVAFFAMVFVFFNYRSVTSEILAKLQLYDSNIKLTKRNNEITDSITYARRIQHAILPSNQLIKELLPDSFILYKPKDIVAGDFYWLETVSNVTESAPAAIGAKQSHNDEITSDSSNHRNNKVIFAAADCTGHGVPGAMVSVVCNNGLNRSVREYGLTNPAEILGKTREIVISEFDKSEEDVKDGMDISLCVLEGDVVKWAGANNPLWIIRNGEIIELAPDRQPIGKFAYQEPFTFHQKQIKKGDVLYVFTDGYVDQFGGPKGKKFKTKAFKKLLLSIHDKTMTKQKELLNIAFEDWRGDLEQIDDVCIIGVRI